MLNFDTKNAMSRVKNAYGKVKNLKKKTKEIICIGAVAFVIGSFVFYDVATGVAYAASAGEAQPHVIKAGGKQIAVVESKAEAEQAVENVKQAYGKSSMETTAIVNPAITIEKKEYITGENVKVLNSVEATKTILEKNSGNNPIFKVHVEQPVVKSETIPYETKEIETDSLEKGERKIETEGVNGSKLVTSKEAMVNGKVVKSEIYTSKVKAEPKKEVVLVGTKEPKAEVKKEKNSNNKDTSRASSGSKSRANHVSYAYDSARSGSISEYAKSFHGVPYVYGGSTPAGFDCSGFTSYVFRKFGISLPHSSAAQARYGRPVSRSEAKPGDLVVMPGHVGIYAGNGMVTHAPKPGQSVTTVPLWTGASFRRLI